MNRASRKRLQVRHSDTAGLCILSNWLDHCAVLADAIYEVAIERARGIDRNLPGILG